MCQADSSLLTVGLLFLVLVVFGILTGSSTTRTNSTFAQNPMFWSIGIGMQLYISMFALLSCSFVGNELGLGWINKLSSVHNDSIIAWQVLAFSIGSCASAAICYALRNLVLLVRPTTAEKESHVRPRDLSSPDLSSPIYGSILPIAYPVANRSFYGILTLFMGGIFAMMSHATVYSFPWQSNWTSTTGVVKSIARSGKVQNVEFSYSADHRQFTWLTG